MSQAASARWGLAWALVAGTTAWIEITPFGDLTLRAFDGFWLLLVAAASVRAWRRRRLPMRTWTVPLAGAAYWPYMVVLVVAPVIGVMAGAGVSGLSSALRFATFASVPWLLGALDLDRAGFWRGVTAGLAVGVALNFGYATLQVLEYQGIPSREWLPHHRLAPYLPQARFDDFGRASGLFLAGNHLAYFGLLTALVFGARFALKPGWSAAVWTALSVALPAMGNSRSALLLTVVLLVGMVVASTFLTRRLRFATVRWVVGLAPLVLAVVAAVVAVPSLSRALRVDRVLQLVEVAQRGVVADNSLRVRIEEFWPTALAGFRAAPLGYGIEPSRIVGTIDSAWITYLLQGSVLLVIAYALFLVGGAWFGLAAVGRSRTTFGEREVAGLALASASVAMAAGSVFLSPLHVPSAMMVVLGLWFAVAGRAREHRGVA